MPDISFIDPGLKKTLEKEISIQVSLNGFSFLIKTKEDRHLAFRHYSFKGIFLPDELIRRVSDILRDDNVLQSEFQKVTLYYITQKSSLIPRDFFNVDTAKQHFEFNHTLDELDELHYTLIEELQAYNLFALPNYLANEFNSKFSSPGINYEHQGSQFLRMAHSLYRENKHIKLYININKGFFDMVVFNEGRLVLYNSYQYVHQTDFIYFLLYACKELQLDAHNEEFMVMGEHSDNQFLLDEIKKYIGEMHFLKHFRDNKTSIQKLDYQQYYTLV
ncbi:MAG: DUF3822 family protein [Bacteroidales bacterium]|nr:DUF3822 family protein [Bacteroidales bacterium]